MADGSCEGRRILVVEDEYFIADEMARVLVKAGIDVLGPVGSVEDAARMLADETGIDGAILDVNLRGQLIFPVADTLTERGIPFAFATGYDESVLPDRFAGVPRMEKPFKANAIAVLLGSLITDTGRLR
jgi:DNA-binding response OmpR family regulator